MNFNTNQSTRIQGDDPKSSFRRTSSLPLVAFSPAAHQSTIDKWGWGEEIPTALNTSRDGSTWGESNPHAQNAAMDDDLDLAAEELNMMQLPSEKWKILSKSTDISTKRSKEFQDGYFEAIGKINAEKQAFDSGFQSGYEENIKELEENPVKKDGKKFAYGSTFASTILNVVQCYLVMLTVIGGFRYIGPRINPHVFSRSGKHFDEDFIEMAMAFIRDHCPEAVADIADRVASVHTDLMDKFAEQDISKPETNVLVIFHVICLIWILLSMPFVGFLLGDTIKHAALIAVIYFCIKFMSTWNTEVMDEQTFLFVDFLVICQHFMNAIMDFIEVKYQDLSHSDGPIIRIGLWDSHHASDESDWFEGFTA